jgi:effector-binding domain-containing protein
MEQEEGIMPYEVTTRELAPQPMISIRTHTPIAKMPEVFGQAFGEMFGYLGEIGVGPAGAPFAVYHDTEMKEDDVDVEICVPVAEQVGSRGQVSASELPGGLAACTLHVGPYSEVGPAYQALMTWIQEHGHEIAGPSHEVYLVSFGQTQDPAQFRTEIVFPIR